MIEHVSLRCSDPRASRAFYEKALAPLGYRVDKEYGDAFGFIQGGRHDFWISSGEVGTPNHLAFHAGSPEEVDAFYRAALEAGGTDNGAPGSREEYGYAAFVLDPDGHNVEAVIWKEELGRKRAPSSASARSASRSKAKPKARAGTRAKKASARTSSKSRSRAKARRKTGR